MQAAGELVTLPLSLPAGWEAKKTTRGKIYYVDHSAKQTCWEPPEALPVAYGVQTAHGYDADPVGSYAAFNPIPAAALAAAATAAMQQQYAAAAERMAFERSQRASNKQ